MVVLVERSDRSSQAISALTAIEVRSAIRRRERAGDILPDDAAKAIFSLEEEIAGIVQYAITRTVTSEARRLVDQHVLRALDAIQLATALVLARDCSGPPVRAIFIAADARLLNAAVAEGLLVWNPASGLPAP
jgi:predicted nucleic acid-binding protein